MVADENSAAQSKTAAEMFGKTSSGPWRNLFVNAESGTQIDILRLLDKFRLGNIVSDLLFTYVLHAKIAGSGKKINRTPPILIFHFRFPPRLAFLEFTATFP